MATLAEHPNIVGVKLTCGNIGKVTRLAVEFSPKQFTILGGASDYLIPSLVVGGSGCVTGVANIFPKCVAKLYALYQEGKIEEAVKFQGMLAYGEKACKLGIAPTKYGAAHFAGPLAGNHDMSTYFPRRPYAPVDETMQSWIIKSMEALEAAEKKLPNIQLP
jgi:2-keto-3-deoxy-L-rhamnonate aldolase